NIKKPHPDVIGFYIVRNERRDEDRIVVDTALFGTLTEANDYKSFGLLAPQQHKPVSNCGGDTNDIGKTVAFPVDSMWFFNPEHQFFQKKSTFTGVEVEGRYVQVGAPNLPTISNQVDP